MNIKAAVGYLCLGISGLAIGCGGEGTENESEAYDVPIGVVSQPLCSGATPSTLKGNIKYVRRWEATAGGCDNTSRVKCSDNGLVFPYGPTLVSAISTNPPVGGSGTYQALATANGDYSICVPGGTTYLLRSNNRDGTLGTNTAVDFGGTAIVGLFSGNHQCVNGGSFPGCGAPTEVAMTIGNAPLVPVGGTVTFNPPPIPAGSPEGDNANTYMFAYMQYLVWSGEYNATTLLPYKMRIQNFLPSDPASTGSTVCRTNALSGSTDCVMSVIIPYGATATNSALFHESGHAYSAYANLRSTGQVDTYDATLSCTGSSHNDNEGVSLQEGIADWVNTMTRWSQATVPAGHNGVHCNNFQYPPTGAQPTPPACGAGSIPNSEFHVEKALIELVDSNAIPNEAGCRNEQISVSPGTVLSALTKFTKSTTFAGCAGNGFEEGGIREGAACGPSSPNWPYTGSNALPTVDQHSLLDVLAIMKTQFGASGTELRNVWANSGWERGDSAVQLP